MEPSGFLLRLTGAAIKTLIKATNAQIRTHGEEHIPDQPVIFVINHFTRMETFFLPYVINKVTGKIVLSLAYHEFFKGGFGTYLSKLGAVSTKDQERDRIMIGALLKGEMPCMIFPEGQMIKDKKLVEKGKYLIYNTGIRRPPHTGAALLALRTEFFREKLRHFRETGNESGIREYLEYFNIGKDRLDAIIRQNTYIVPVNITYFPIRARNNIINRIASLLVDKMPERLEEELEVEGTMLVDGVDIDINFGKTIPIVPYMENRAMRKLLSDEKTYLQKEEMSQNLHFKKPSLDLMRRYMDSIYQMTTVNHDHIFSYILRRCNKNRISETEFKNRAFLAIKRIRNVPIQSHHTNLKLRQSYLLTDDEHMRYNSFITAAKSDGLIKLEKGYIIKTAERFSRPYEFHTIRKDNIVEVLSNEIEPLPYLTKFFNRIMLMPSFLIRRIISKSFLKLDQEIFERDYNKFQLEGETKSRNIGRPRFLTHFFNRKGVLLIHGYLAAPEEVRQLAEFLHKSGFTVYCVRMRGHGTSPDDLATREWEEWYESANRGYIVLKNSVKKMAIAGFSTGAGIALLQAHQKPGCFNSVVSISAPLHLSNIASRFASSVVFWNKLLGAMKIKKGRMEFVDNTPENPHINYFRNPVSGVRELEKLMDVVRDILGKLHLPVLVIQGAKDPTVAPESSLELFEKLGTRKKELFRIYSERHGIVNGEGSAEVFEKVKDFLEGIFSREEH